MAELYVIFFWMLAIALGGAGENIDAKRYAA
jgi:hypothetical protein